jgi:hypothetical protein
VALLTLLALLSTASPVAADRAAETTDRHAMPVAAADQPEIMAFPTPEDAIREYLAGVADADVDRILRATAVDEASEGFRLDLLTDRLRSFIPFTTMAPAEYPFFADVNRASQSARVLGQVRNLAYGLLSDVEIDGAPVLDVDKAWAESFVGQVDPSRLSSLAIAEIRFSDAEFEDDTRYLASATTQASIYGADEQTERLVLFSFDGDLYDIGFTLLRYGDDWKVFSQNAPLVGTSALGTARPTTADEFDRQTRGD